MANRNDRSEQIPRTAMQLFYERGFDGVGVDLIGEMAGMSGPAIYRYFRGNDEILMTLLDEAIDRVLMSTGGQFDDPLEELERLVRGHVQRALEDLGNRIAFGSPSAKQLENLRQGVMRDVQAASPFYAKCWLPDRFTAQTAAAAPAGLEPG